MWTVLSWSWWWSAGDTFLIRPEAVGSSWAEEPCIPVCELRRKFYGGADQADGVYQWTRLLRSTTTHHNERVITKVQTGMGSLYVVLRTTIMFLI
ncbi:hypothetical protein EDB83DRAFT_2352925 [Lactarius deliciosus]|nr:hypothetical protein EDB83DRAFT_2352925 [Lactarius deliciosus]